MLETELTVPRSSVKCATHWTSQASRLQISIMSVYLCILHGGGGRVGSSMVGKIWWFEHHFPTRLFTIFLLKWHSQTHQSSLLLPSTASPLPWDLWAATSWKPPPWPQAAALMSSPQLFWASTAPGIHLHKSTEDTCFLTVVICFPQRSSALSEGHRPCYRVLWTA